MRQCSKCKEYKDENEYYQSSIRKATYCKLCFNNYTIERWKRRKIQAIQYKGSKCIDCNISYPNANPVIFDFHHLDPSQKDYDWNKLRLMSLDKIKKELDKCVLLCSNCHRVRHSND